MLPCWTWVVVRIQVVTYVCACESAVTATGTGTVGSVEGDLKVTDHLSLGYLCVRLSPAGAATGGARAARSRRRPWPGPRFVRAGGGASVTTRGRTTRRGTRAARGVRARRAHAGGRRGGGGTGVCVQRQVRHVRCIPRACHRLACPCAPGCSVLGRARAARAAVRDPVGQVQLLRGPAPAAVMFMIRLLFMNSDLNSGFFILFKS